MNVINALIAVSVLSVGALASAAGLLTYWTLASWLSFRRLGYRIRQAPPRQVIRWVPGPQNWIYEELSADGELVAFPFVRVTVTNGYPATSEVLFPDAREWSDKAPPWAQGRRDQILERVVQLAGATTTRAAA